MTNRSEKNVQIPSSASGAEPNVVVVLDAEPKRPVAELESDAAVAAPPNVMPPKRPPAPVSVGLAAAD